MCGLSTIVKHGPGYREVYRLRCKSWNCEYCRPKRRHKLIREAMDGEPNTIITLTLRAEWAEKPEEAVKVLSRAWSIIRKRDARRRKAKPIPFLTVVEKTKNGTPHLHIICRCKWMDQKWLSMCMDEIADAPIVDIRRIDNPGRVAGYCAKYISKDCAKVGSNKRYWQSQDYRLCEKWVKPGLREGEHWGEPISQAINQVLKIWEGRNVTMEWKGNDCCLVVWPPD